MSLPDHVEKLLKQRYYKPGEDWAKLVQRVVDSVCVDESTEFKAKMYNYIFDRIFLPNSPCLVNAGTQNNGKFACFVAGPSEDDLGVHLDTLKDIAQVAKAGGGCGLTGTFIRPEGSPVAGSAHGVAYGPNNYAIQVNDFMKKMTQGSFRQMALMVSLRSDHPDIEKFIELKQSTDESKGALFNQSVMATDNFMEAATKDVTTKQHKILTKMAQNAWNNGEPGLLFYDTINNNTPYMTCDCKPIETTNPCVLEGTLVNTPNGLVKVEMLVIGDEIATVLGYEPIKHIEVNNNIQTYKVEFSDGGVQFVTASHIYHVKQKGSNSKRVSKDLPLLQLQPGDLVQVHSCKIRETTNNEDGSYIKGLKQGVLLGDGCYTEKVISSDRIKICTSTEDITYNKNLCKLFDITSKLNTTKGSKSANFVLNSNSSQLLQELSLTPKYAHEKSIPFDTTESIEHLIGVLDGLLATDGNVNLKSNHPQLRWTTTSSQLAQDIRSALLLLGIHGRIFKSSERGGIIGGREIKRKHSKLTIIVSGVGVKDYYNYSKLNLIHPEKGERLQKAVTDFMLTGNTWTTTIKSITPHIRGTVYDIYCEKSDTWITNGYVQRGCGEQLLPEYGSCNLGSINLNNPAFFTNNKFDYNVLRTVVVDCIQFLDDVGIHNKFPNAKFADWYDSHRPVGLGIMGYADLLLKLGIPYGSSDAINLLHNILKCMYETATIASENLGVTRGIPNHCEGVNRRNITVLSIAPTGSISFIADCSSSIEPIFAPTFTRQDERGEYYSFELESAHLPHFKSAINELDPTKVVTWQEHVNTQVIAQMWVDSGVSKTINMPENATVQDVYDAFVMAWQKGAKGITVYRNNSRQKQVLTTNPTLPKGTNFTKRPKILPADVYNVRVGKDNWLLAVGLLEDKPYEIFAFRNNNSKYIKNGTIEKIQSRVYNLNFGENEVLALADITQYNTDVEQALTRQISLAMRSGIELKFVVEQLAKSEGSVTSFAKAVNRILAKYTTETNIKCNECNAKEVVSEGGCFVCKVCGNSKCG